MVQPYRFGGCTSSRNTQQGLFELSTLINEPSGSDFRENTANLQSEMCKNPTNDVRPSTFPIIPLLMVLRARALGRHVIESMVSVRNFLVTRSTYMAHDPSIPHLERDFVYPPQGVCGGFSLKSVHRASEVGDPPPHRGAKKAGANSDRMGKRMPMLQRAGMSPTTAT